MRLLRVAAEHLLALVILGLLLPGRLVGQGLPSGTPSAVDPSLTRLFGEFQAFSADASVQVYDRNEQEVVNTAMRFAIRDGKIRMDVDLSKLKSKDLPAGAAASLKQLGMDKVVSLVLPEKKCSYVIYPGLESVLKVPLKEEDLKLSKADFKLERKVLGREAIDGHPCIKYRVSVKNSSGAAQEAMTWNATDLKGFPVQIQTSDGEHLVIMRFRSPNLTAPATGLFVVPATYTQYDDQQSLMQAVMMKVLGSHGGE